MGYLETFRVQLRGQMCCMQTLCGEEKPSKEEEKKWPQRKEKIERNYKSLESRTGSLFKGK